VQPLWFRHNDGHSYNLKSNKPVMMMGSMRPATVIGVDASANLYHGMAVAAYPGAKGWGGLLLLNDDVHYARETAKTNGAKLDTFNSLNEPGPE